MTPRGKQIRLFYTTGQHNGVIRAELLNWTGYVYSAPRSACNPPVIPPQKSIS